MLTSSISLWYESSDTTDIKALKGVMRAAEKTIGVTLPPTEGPAQKRLLTKAPASSLTPLTLITACPPSSLQEGDTAACTAAPSGSGTGSGTASSLIAGLLSDCLTPLILILLMYYLLRELCDSKAYVQYYCCVEKCGEIYLYFNLVM